MPFLNQHAARLYDPSKLSDYHRTAGGALYGGNLTVPKTVGIIWGKTTGEDGHLVAQALRFNSAKWTEAEARKWLKDNDVHFISFTPATGKDKEEVKKCSSNELMESLADLMELAKVQDSPDLASTILMLKVATDELATRKDMLVNKDAGVFDFDNIQKQGAVTFEADGAFANLILLDKEASPVQGIVRYSLGYALDTAKAFKGQNIVKACDIDAFRVDAAAGDVMRVAFGMATPEMVGDRIGVKLEKAYVLGKSDTKKVDSARSILKAADSASILTTDREMLTAMSTAKILNVDVDKQFGVELEKTVPIFKSEESWKEGVVYGIVYSVEEVDSDGDYASAEEVQKACWKFMEDYQTMNIMHTYGLEKSDYALVECACALSDVKIGENEIKKGDWYIAVRVNNPQLREMIESEELSSFSMEGTASKGEPIPELEAEKQKGAKNV